MINRLFIQNLATVKKQIIDFTDGFSVLTGETGAGKSIIIRSINLILGEKIPKDLIRAGEEFLSVEAVFSIDDNVAVKAILADLDIEHDDQLTIRRKSHRNGKSTIYINDYSSKLNQLALLGKHLIDLHGQHAQQTLLHVSSHIDFLDQFAGLNDTVLTYGGVYHALTNKIKRRSELEQNATERAQKSDFLKFQIDEIETAGFTDDELQGLTKEYQRLTHAEQILDTLSPVADWHTGQNPVLSDISAELRRMNELQVISPELRRFAKEIQSGLITLEEVAADVQQYVSKFEIDPAKLESINERLAEFDLLKRKYGQNLAEISLFKDEREAELLQLSKIDADFGALDSEITELTQQARQMADHISKQRQIGKTAFEKLVLGNLKELGMEKCEFSIAITRAVPDTEDQLKLNSKGIDQVEFLIATNPGNPLKPLSKIASGGEISRIMLAIKTSLNEDISKGAMIFDEVDAGISGRVSEIVGQKLSGLGDKRQVICITHSPQIAAKATHHFRVEKEVGATASTTIVTTLSPEMRVEEIAKFLGGDTITQKTLSLAKDMLAQ